MLFASSISPRCLRFRRWNRHGYSTFCSIGKCVNIGSVRKEIADKSLKKGQSAIIPDKSSMKRYLEEQESQQHEPGLALEVTAPIDLAICMNLSQDPTAQSAGRRPVPLFVTSYSEIMRYPRNCPGLFLFKHL